MPGHIICDDDHAGPHRFRIALAVTAVAALGAAGPAAALVTPNPGHVIEKKGPHFRHPCPGHVIENRARTL